MGRSRSRDLMFALAALAVGCGGGPRAVSLAGSGGATGPGGGGQSGRDAAARTVDVAPADVDAADGAPPSAGGAGLTPFRRLTRFEYENTVRDLLGTTEPLLVTLDPDQESSGSGFLAGGAVTPAGVATLDTAARTLASAAASRLATLLPCGSPPAARAEQDDCAARFIRHFGRRAFRRPLGDEEAKALYERVYLQLRNGPDAYDFPSAIRVVITAFLQAPGFLYRWELGPRPPSRAGDVVKLDPHELASRLSYLLWASMPDDDLFAAAESGALATPAELEKQARRLLAHERARDSIAEFHRGWLDLHRLEVKELVTRVGPWLSPVIFEETRRFTAATLLDPGADGRLETLLTSNNTFVEDHLSAIYGRSPLVVSWEPTTLDPTQRAGLLTQAGFLIAHAAEGQPSPSQRGGWVLERLLCRPIEHHASMKPPAMSGLANREVYTQIGAGECAKSCHPAVDAVGFAFGHYDARGVYYPSDGAKPLDTSGELLLDGQPRKFADAVELVRQLAQAKETRDCVVRQWLRYTLRRKETPDDEASITAIARRFEQSSYDVRELLVAIVTTPAFTTRRPEAGEATP